jgi:uncharacterized lipoprotein YbaY/heat shock protein HslJ
MPLAGQLLLLLTLAAPADENAITGKASYRERLAVPGDAVFEVMLLDVSRADAPAPVVAKQTSSPAGAMPFAVRVPYDPSKIDPKRRYSVRATLRSGPMRWSTDAVYPVLTHGAGKTVDLLLKRIGEPPRPGSFDGTLPCADCPGIVHQLALFSDGAYYLRREYLERPSGIVDEVGTWAVSTDGKTLALYGGVEGPGFFAVKDPDRLTKLDTEGQPIASDANHDLRRSARPTAIEPRLALPGLVTCKADAVSFQECRTGRRLALVGEAGNEVLDPACAAALETPGQPVYAVVEGRIVERVSGGRPARPTLVAETLVDVRPGEVCPPRPRTEPLTRTYWKLGELDGAPVPPNEKRPPREPHLVFASQGERVVGADGCNSVGGGYTLDEAKLTFTRFFGTLMACPDADDFARRFHDALEKTASHRVIGPTLELFDAAGRRLARFEAVPGRTPAPRPARSKPAAPPKP